jgi:hypothetical protein
MTSWLIGKIPEGGFTVPPAAGAACVVNGSNSGGGPMPPIMIHGCPKRSRHSSNAPISKPPIAGRACPRWSVAREVPRSAVCQAGLFLGIAMVGVKPTLFCSGPRSGSPLVTTPWQLSLFWIRLPTAPTATVPDPCIEHSVAPLLAIIVFSSVKSGASDGEPIRNMTMPPPDPVLGLPLMVEFTTVR